MRELGRGQLHKLRGRLDRPVSYELPLGDSSVPLNQFLGKAVRLQYEGRISCVNCGRVTSKSFNQGYCYPCFQKLAECDGCVIAPEKCHYDAGTCRDPLWGEEFCMQDHVVYFANSSGIKVGITRASQIPTRWVDQGAVQALPILRVRTRQQSGFAEVMFRRHIADRTNWREMLRGESEALDLAAERDRLLEECRSELDDLRQQFGLHAINVLNGMSVTEIQYPVREYPGTINSFNLDKNPVAEGILLGIKGQYLIFDSGVINVRKYTGYEISVHV